MASAVIAFSDNVNPDLATVGVTVTVVLDGLLVNSDNDLRDLASTIAMSDIIRQSCGMGGAEVDPFVNSIDMTGEIRSVYSSRPAIPPFRVG